MEDTNNALLHIKAKHNGEIPYQYGRKECAKLMDSYAKEYQTAQLKLLGIGGVSKSLNMEHYATSVEYAEAIIDIHKNPENSNKDWKILVIENTIDKLRQDLANI
jgi:hypothetical protein